MPNLSSLDLTLITAAVIAGLAVAFAVLVRPWRQETPPPLTRAQTQAGALGAARRRGEAGEAA